jgi:hypothetical protein
MRRITILCALVAWSVATAAAHRIVLKDGTTLQGTFISGSNSTITFKDLNGNTRRFDVTYIQSIDFSDNSYARSRGSGLPPSGISPEERGSRDRSSDRNDRSDSAYELPAGSEVAVRTNEAIDSNTATEGRTYSAVVDREVTDSSGRVVIPRGSDAELVIRSMSSGGTTSSPELALDLQSVMVNGRRYLVSTADVERSGREGIGKNRRTAEMVGGGAVLGTLLGAIAGGGKGAAIGAIAGAAAGGTAQVLTKGKEVKVPAETLLTFRLDEPVRLQTR